MQRCRVTYVIVLGASLLGAAGSGCRQEPISQAAVPRPSPQESFEEIVRVVTTALDTNTGGVPSGFVSSDDGGRSQFVVNNEVTSQLIPPEREGDIYRGTITVASRSYYSLLRSDGPSISDKKARQESDFSMLDDSDGRDGELSAGDDGLI